MFVDFTFGLRKSQSLTVFANRNCEPNYENHSKSSAYTLVELIVSITLLAVIIGIFVLIFVQGMNQLTYAKQLHNASALAEIYLNEVIATGRWDESSSRIASVGICVPLSIASLGAEESSRPDYDDCDDYNGFSASGRHKFKNGESMNPGFSIYTASIKVDFVQFGETMPSSSTTNIKRITVRITWGANNSTVLSTVLTNI